MVQATLCSLVTKNDYGAIAKIVMVITIDRVTGGSMALANNDWITPPNKCTRYANEAPYPSHSCEWSTHLGHVLFESQWYEVQATAQCSRC